MKEKWLSGEEGFHGVRYMVFSSDSFLFLFLPVTVIVYYLLQDRVKNLFLLAASFLFLLWNRPAFWWFLPISILVNYGCAVLIRRSSGSRFHGFRTVFFLIGILGNLLPLFYFKYYNFCVGIMNQAAGTTFPERGTAMPPGISFYTFCGIAYLADVYSGKTKADRNPFHAALYLSFFPKLLEGPIARYDEVRTGFEEHSFRLDNLACGAERFILGLAKKVILADSLGEMVDAIWTAGVGQNTVPIAWLGAIGYTFQIYFDFAGYSDMAVGIGRMFGFHLPENFNCPYRSGSISEFWRRWHITLGTWFRDYVYIPLGGNRKGEVRTYRNLAIVFFLTGLWHGAAWHYIVWGMLNGLLVLLERVVKTHGGRKQWGRWRHNLTPADRESDAVKRMPIRSAGRIFFTFLITNLMWVLFRAPDLGTAVRYLGTMFGIGLGSRPGFRIVWYLDRWRIFVLLIAALLSFDLPKELWKKWNQRGGRGSWTKVKPFVKYGSLLVLLYLSILRVVSGSYNAFIYFQF